MIKAALFDFDGTLAETAPDFHAALNRLRARRGLPPLSLNAVRGMASGGARAMLAGMRGEPEKLRRDFLRCYEQTNYAQTTLFAGIAGLLVGLQAGGRRWGIATNKPRRYLAPMLPQLALTGAACVFAGDDCARAKPHPDMLLAAAARLKLAARQCVYVGDDERDAIAAAAAKMPFIAAAWGYWRPRQWRADKLPVAGIAATPAALLALLKSFR